MEDQYKDYDPKQYKGVGIMYTVSVLEERIKELERVKRYLSAEAVKTTEVRILELKNNISFLKQYR